MKDTLLSLQCWILTKASADAERAESICHVHPQLAELLRRDAQAARFQAFQIAGLLEPAPRPTQTSKA